MATRLKHYLLAAVATLSLVLMPVAANAQYVQLFCNNGAVGGGQFFYAVQGQAGGQGQGACNFPQPAIKHVFSQIVCSFVTVLNSVLGQVYCGIQYTLTPVLAALLTLYIAVFGAQILMGTAQLNGKEIILRMIKIVAVWLFATQSTWGLTLIFQFLLGAASQGSMWVINSIHQINPNIMPVTTASGDLMPIYLYLDTLIYNAITGPFTTANDKVTGFFIVLMFFVPAVFTMAVTWVVTTLMMLARTVVYFLLCLSAIAFLIALSPIFLSFMLFQSTVYFFEDWLKHLISYSLQIVIVFAIISMWIAAMSLFGGFFNELAAVVWPYQHVLETNVFSPDDTYGVCQFIKPVQNAPPGQPGQGCGNGPCLPALQCQPALNPGSGNAAIAAAGQKDLIHPSQLIQNQDFINFMVYNLTVLIIIAYTFGVLVKEAPKIATQLSGPAQVPMLVDGIGMKGFGQLGGGGARGVAENPPPAPPPPSGNASKGYAAAHSQTLTGRSKPPSS